MPENIGDIYSESFYLFLEISDPNIKKIAENSINQLRSTARNAEIGWIISSKPPIPSHKLNETEQIQLIALNVTLFSFCYGVERLNETSLLTSPDSIPVRFYINSIYHYIAALYLLDKNDDPIGGMVYKTINPMGLSSILEPIKQILDRPMEGNLSFGETIKKIRNDFMVHGTFSPNDVASVINKAKLREQREIIHLSDLIWELFNQSFILELKIIALLTSIGTNTQQLLDKINN